MSVTTIDEYLAQFSGEVLERINQIREAVRVLAPNSEESLSYGLIGYKLKGKPLVYVGGFAHHIGFYATPNGHEAFKDDFAKYKQGKGSVQFPLDQPLPIELIERVIQYRVQTLKSENG